MRIRIRTAVGALLFFAAACGDAVREQPAAPTAPSLAVSSGACSSTLRQQASDYIDLLYTGSQRTAAKQLLTNVAQACSTTDSSAARSAMFVLMRYNVSTLALGTKTDANDSQLKTLANLWNTLVVFIGSTSTNISSAAFTTAGAVRIVSDPATFDSVPRASGVNASGDFIDIVTADAQALLRVPKGAATGRTILYTIAPISCAGLASNLPVQAGKCYDATDTPNFDAAFAKLLTVAICQTQNPNAPAPINANAISHLNQGATVPEVLPLKYVVSGTAFCSHPPGPFDPSSNVFARVWNGITNFASRLVGPKTLWAVHGNLGGTTPGISPFGPIDRDIFRATFTANALGALSSPTSQTFGNDVGSWSDVFAQPPGSINVVAALDEATNKPIVLNQAGGNCANTCGGLRLEGQVITSFQGEAIDEDIGKYVVTWDLVQDKPSVKEAPFMLLTGGSPRDTIVKITYVTLPSGRFINVNGAAFTQGGTRLSWVPGRLQRFRFQIDLTTSPAASCTLSVTPLTGPTPAAVTNDCSRGASLVGKRLRFVRADFTGIDAGVFAWDDIRVSLFSTTPLAPQ